MFWAWIVKSIIGAAVGSMFYSWWEDTKMGQWFNRKMDKYLTWASEKLHFKYLTQDEEKYNNLPDKLKEELANHRVRIQKLEDR